MLSIFYKEINTFFSSLIAYLVIAVFLVMNGLFMWVFADTNILDYNFATMDPMFNIAPFVLLFLIPAITMKSFSEERQKGTMEFLLTKPLTETEILLGKYFANLVLVLFALLPTIIYYYSVYQLGSPKGNLDSGAIFGSYIGLVFLAASFVAIGMFASALTENQIVAFILAAFLCFAMHWSFNYLSLLPSFIGRLELVVASFGMASHYDAMSKGAIDTRDVIYFLSVIILFLTATYTVLTHKK